MFKPKKKSVTIGRKKESSTKKQPHVYRLVNQYRNELPEQMRNVILEHLKKIGDKNFVWSYDELSPEEVGENVLKILYIWNESDKKGSFKDFVANKFEQCILTKDLIIAKIRNEYENNEE